MSITVLLVVQRCISKILASTKILASATEHEFREFVQSNDGANPKLRLPGEGRALALQLHKSACVVQQEATAASETSIRGMCEHTNAQESQRGRKRACYEEASQLEALADKLEDRRKRRKDRSAMGRASSSSSSDGSFDVTDKLSDMEMTCLLYTSPSPRDKRQSRMPSSA